MDNNGEDIKITKHDIVGLFTTGKELTLELLYEIANPYRFRDLEWMDFKLYSNLKLVYTPLYLKSIYYTQDNLIY